MKESGICVLINSCDKYSDLWDPFFHFFEKNWSDCPYPVYLATNSKLYSRKNVQQIFSGVNGTWSEETTEILNKIPYQYLIYLQDDYLITKKVDNEKIYSLVKKMKNYSADYIRLFPSPGPDKDYESDNEVGFINKTANYRTSLQCAIWKTEIFMALLKKEENQWEFEMNSPIRSENYLFLSVKQLGGQLKNHVYPITYFYLTAVVRGKWRKQAATLCEQEGIKLNSQIRKIETNGEMIYHNFYEASPLFIKKVFDFMRYRIF